MDVRETVTAVCDLRVMWLWTGLGLQTQQDKVAYFLQIIRMLMAEVRSWRRDLRDAQYHSRAFTFTA